MSGKWFKPVPYDVRRDDQRIDLEQVARLAREHKPRLIIAGGSAYPRIHRLPRFSAKSATRSARCYWWTWRTSLGLVAGGVTHRHSRMRMW